MEEIRSLAKLINDAIQQIDDTCSLRGASFPPLAEPFSPESEAVRNDAIVLQASANIVAAAAQLSAIVQPPPMTLLQRALQFHVPSALRIVIQAHVVEILRPAGREGLHIDEIAKLNSVNAGRLARVLHLLATEHLFTEVKPNAFAVNRISSVFDTGKDISEILAKPEEKYIGTSGVAAFMHHMGDHAFKSSAYLPEALLDPKTANSTDEANSSFNRAYRTDQTFWKWLQMPGNEEDRRTFGMGMQGASKMTPADGILHDHILGYDWSSLSPGSIVVDIAGGVGSQTLLVARAHPHLKHVVQDLDGGSGEMQKFWEIEYPKALKRGDVTFQGIDLFKDQPVKNAAVFFMRMILHDWSDERCIDILKILRAAAQPDTRLLIIDVLLAYATPQLDDSASATSSSPPNVQDNTVPKPPFPLLSNGGHANSFPYLLDHSMMNINAQERTLDEFNVICLASGWRIDKVFPVPYFGGGHTQMAAVPA